MASQPDDDDEPALFLTSLPRGRNDSLAALAAMIDEDEDEDAAAEPQHNAETDEQLQQPLRPGRHAAEPTRKRRRGIGEAQVTLALIGLEQKPCDRDEPEDADMDSGRKRRCRDNVNVSTD